MTKDEWILKEIETYEKRNGPLPAHNRATLRILLAREFEEAEWSNRDYSYGFDEGMERLAVNE